MNLACVVHYENYESYSQIKTLSETNKDRILQAKCLRRSIGGEHLHVEQCKLIPERFDADVHGIHLEPCYKKFTMILSSKVNEPSSSSQETRRSSRLSSVGSNDSDDRPSVLYPEECFVCGKNRLQRSKKNEYPKVISTFTAQETIKEAARSKRPQFYFQIKDEDLLAKELRYHNCCYREFTRGFSISQEATNSLVETAVTEETELQEQGDYIAVKNYINEQIFNKKQAVSISVLHSVYGLKVGDTRYRKKLKDRILKDIEFKTKLKVLSFGHKIPEVLVDASVEASEISFKNRDGCILKAAEYLRDDIQSFIDRLPEIHWPPDAEELQLDDRSPPPTLISFLDHLMGNDVRKSKQSESLTRYRDSCASDLIAAVGRGKIVTAKQFLLALGLHNITGQRRVIDILHRLGHCLDYNTTVNIETAQAVKAQVMSEEESILPLTPRSDDGYVLTYFWVDNFDVKVDRQTGSNCVNTTHLVAFQERCDSTIHHNPSLSVPKSANVISTDVSKTKLSFDAKKEPKLLIPAIDISFDVVFKFHTKFFFWLWLRKHNSFDQEIPSFPGWLLTKRKIGPLEKTVLTYLPPITSKVNEITTIVNYMEYLQKLAFETNMRYVNMTLDVGAAINAFKVQWNHPEKFGNIVIHLGDFHFMKENFQVIGDFISGSGWEEIVFQSGLSTSGSLLAVLSGSHYNRAWNIHSAVGEALERLLLMRWLYDVKPVISPEMNRYAADPGSEIEEELELQCEEVYQEYNQYRQRVRNGLLGPTAQFWLTYMDLLRGQHLIHTAVQENLFDMRLFGWQFFLPYYFRFNKTNYARYGSFYLEMMKAAETYYPGLREMLEIKGLSVQAQEKHPVRVAIDQRGEQTINRDAKTAGGIKAFSTNDRSVLKWCLNRAEQAKNTKALTDMCGIGTDPTVYRPCRPSQISKSEDMVQRVMKVLQEEYINPFGFEVSTDVLVNISSGVDAGKDATEFLLSSPTEGQKQYKEFVRGRLYNKDIDFHRPINRNTLKTFKSSVKKTQLKNRKTVDVNRDMLAKLLHISHKNEKLVDFKEALKYPLSEVPLSLCNADGTMRKTDKSKLSKLIQKTSNNEIVPESEQSRTTFIVDLMALIRTVKCVPETFENLALHIIKMLPKGYNRVDIVADSYFPNSIKGAEREKRGSTSAIIVKSAQSKIPRDFHQFLSCGENKKKMIELLFSSIEAKRAHVLNLLRTNNLVLSQESGCKILTLSSSEEFGALCSNHEEADTKVIAHAYQALKHHPEEHVIIRSPSGDTDILVLVVSLLNQYRNRLIIDNGSGTNRKEIWLGNLEIEESKATSLVGLHAFTGNDYLSNFFKKGKEKCWNTMEKFPKFESAFKQLGCQESLSEPIFALLEEFVCYLYGHRIKKIDEARWKLFQRKQQTEHKVPDLATLPPCRRVLQLHAMRANYVAYIWRNSRQPNLQYPDITSNGWHATGDIQWIDEAFPDDVEILLDESDDGDYEYGSEIDTDIEEFN